MNLFNRRTLDEFTASMKQMVERVVGRLLRPLRQHDDRLAWNDPRLNDIPDVIRLESPDFLGGGLMPLRCAGRGVGDNFSPALRWTGVPAESVELVLVVEDPDAPLPKPIVHLIAFGIDPRAQFLAAGAANTETAGVVRLGRGAFGRTGYAGPRPVRGHGVHRYIFQMFALTTPIVTDKTVTLPQLIELIAGHVSARGRLVGLYERL